MVNNENRDANAVSFSSVFAKAKGQARKELLEVGKDRISSVLVNQVEVLHKDVPAVPSYREHYLSGDSWIEIYFRIEIGGHPRDYVAVTRARGLHGSDSRLEFGSVNGEIDRQQLKDSMLVSVSKFV